ncbi:MAG TPA: cytochrome c oxidase assembly protein [Rhizomicrobium sp.]|jgi:putative membrane protein|nr:cytochrome c oxidase assembly protein [Rhizomicrobium sp.]
MTALSLARPRNDWFAYGALLAVGAALDIACRLFPAQLPFWLPWEFSWPVFLATALTLAWFMRGWRRLAAAERPALWRAACFVAGVLSFYVVLQTHLDYLAQHMFFVHRAAHFVLHHAGAFLIALGASGPVIRAGMPGFLTPIVDAKPLRRALNVLQHPAVAPILFVGLLYFWLLPAIHTRVMLDANLYDLMNWTMALNGVMFWSLVLDPRPKPPARLSHLMRGAMILIIELPQMVLGAILSLSTSDYYPVYAICGRIFAMTALNDQHYGGLIIWLPGTLTSFAAMIVVLVTMRLNEEAAERAALAQHGSAP